MRVMDAPFLSFLAGKRRYMSKRPRQKASRRFFVTITVMNSQLPSIFLVALLFQWEFSDETHIMYINFMGEHFI